MKSWMDAPRKKITPNNDPTYVSFVSDETAFQTTGPAKFDQQMEAIKNPPPAVFVPVAWCEHKQTNAHSADCCLQASKKIAEAICLLVLVDGTEDMVKHLRLIAAVADEMGRP